MMNEFEQFWKAYPRKVGKLAAQKSWLKMKPDLSEVLNALEWQAKQKQWLDGFIPHPSTYLNQGRWMDERQDLKEVVKIRNKGHFMTDDQFNNWLNGDKNERLA